MTATSLLATIYGIKALEEVTRDALELAPHQRLALAECLLKNADIATDLNGDVAWDVEIRDRIRAVDEGRVVGIAYDDVMREANVRLHA